MESQVLEKISIQSSKTKVDNSEWMQTWNINRSQKRMWIPRILSITKMLLKRNHLSKTQSKRIEELTSNIVIFHPFPTPKANFFQENCKRKIPKTLYKYCDLFHQMKPRQSINISISIFQTYIHDKNQSIKGRKRDPLTIYSYHSNKFSQIYILITLKHNNSFIKIF